MKFLAASLAIALSVLAVACSGDDDDPDPTATSPAAPSVTTPAGSPTAAASATVESTTTAAPSPTSVATLPPTDGTVPPQNAGSTNPFPLKSLPDPNTGIYTLTDVRVGAHPESGGWDRIVFEFEDVAGFPGAHPGGIVEYVDEPILSCGPGTPVEVEGEAILRVKLDATQAHTDAGQPTIDANRFDGPGNSILEAAATCDFEGIVEWAVGVSGEENFKVIFLENPSRLVIDVKWP